MRARINNIDLAYDDHGMGPPIIFLHAFPLNRGMWEGQIVALLNERQNRLVAPDWRGFGESAIGEDVSTMELFADDIAALMDELGMQKAILCGLSMGGYVSFAFLRKYPQRVSGLILANTRPDADSEEGRANRAKVAALVMSQGVEAIADLQVPRLLADNTRQQHPEVEARVRQMVAAANPQGIAAASRGMGQRVDSTDILPHITCPTLVIGGEHDQIVPPAVAQQYAAQIPAAELAIIPHAGHLSNLEQPESFLQVVSSFLYKARTITSDPTL